MATQVIVLSETVTPKPIVFTKHLTSTSFTFSDNPSLEPKDYKQVILLIRNYGNTGIDLLLGRDAIRLGGDTLYLGHFNDGII